MDRQTPLIIITGPTCSGKTGIALKIARTYPIEVISADSMQVYRHMDIATAKPTPAERRQLEHHIIDVRDPDEEFNAGMFCSLASEMIPEIRSRGRIPVIAGGTGLYIKALVYGLAPAPPRSAKLRAYFRTLQEAQGCSGLWHILKKLDPESAEKISNNDAVRIIRALEIVFLTGLRPSTVLKNHGFAVPRYETRTVCVMPDRERLYKDIDVRVHTMIEQGLVQETEKLLDLGFDPGLRSMQTLAYKHAVAYLRSEIGLESAVSRIQRDTRHYAKRQLTWLKSHYDAGSFHNADAALGKISAWLSGSSGA